MNIPREIYPALTDENLSRLYMRGSNFQAAKISRNIAIYQAFRDGGTFKAVGFLFSVTPERVRQIVHKVARALDRNWKVDWWIRWQKICEEKRNEMSNMQERKS